MITFKPRAVILAAIAALILFLALGCRSGELTAIDGGWYFVCGLRSDGSPVCWGNGSTEVRPDPHYWEDNRPRGEKFAAITAS